VSAGHIAADPDRSGSGRGSVRVARDAGVRPDGRPAGEPGLVLPTPIGPSTTMWRAAVSVLRIDMTGGWCWRISVGGRGTSGFSAPSSAIRSRHCSTFVLAASICSTASRPAAILPARYDSTAMRPLPMNLEMGSFQRPVTVKWREAGLAFTFVIPFPQTAVGSRAEVPGAGFRGTHEHLVDL
jgi:hypothetical protein